MVHSGGGDPARSMALLWGAERPARARGRQPALTIRQITTAAIELADVEGLDALSMRRVAERLGVGTMSLYTYVPGKAELIDLMLDAIYTETSPGPPPAASWRERLEHVAHENWDRARRHPWMLQIAASSRPPLGPGLVAKYERELETVDGLGLSDIEMDAVIALINDYVQGAARGAVDAVSIRQATGIDDETWWAAAAPWLNRVFDPRRYPVAARVGAAAGEYHRAAYDPGHAFEFGLQRVLDGVGALIQRPRS
ncbi:MAG TPA: TetR/AcrR family transcriptional regulator [Streptosporangiaceae bacterium]